MAAPTITPSITCDPAGDTMTIEVQIDGKLPDQQVSVSHLSSSYGGTNAMPAASTSGRST